MTGISTSLSSALTSFFSAALLSSQAAALTLTRFACPGYLAVYQKTLPPPPGAKTKSLQVKRRAKNGFRNRLLGRLPTRALRSIERQLEQVEAKSRESIFEPNAPIESVYFPETAVGSVLTVLEDGTETEVATVGFEGMIGMPLFFGADRSPGRAFWQISGRTHRLKAEVLRRATVHGGPLTETLHLYTQALFTQLSQSATCNRIHSLEERCCRWLLMTHDRVEGDEFEITHEFLALMLGVRRSGVTIAAGILQKAGLIRYSRGRMTIIDREGLEKAACECHRVVNKEFDRLLG
jgi:CRP-like cAMP-binding protein